MSSSHNCPQCGLPRSLNSRLVWTTDGGIYFQARDSERLVFLDEDDINLVIGEAEKVCGDSILERLRQCRRDFTREVVASQLRGLRSFLFRHWPLNRRILRTTLEEAALFGCGNIEITNLSPRKEVSLTARHPYHPHLLAGDIWGFWEGLYRVEAELSLRADTNLECDITVRTRGKRGREESSREKTRRPDRDYGLEVCEKCRLPRYPWELRWDTELGTIYQAGTHHHMTLTYARGWQMVLDVIEKSMEHGFSAAVGKVFSQGAAERYRAVKGDNYKTAYRNFFVGLPFLGWGKPTRVTRKPFLLDAEVEGPPFPQLLGWKMEGVYEALEREPAETDRMKTEDSKWRYLIGPVLEGVFLGIERMQPEPGTSAYPRTILPF